MVTGAESCTQPSPYPEYERARMVRGESVPRVEAQVPAISMTVVPFDFESGPF
jgi:hypothetical protein